MTKDELGAKFAKWQSENPDKPAYMFGFDGLDGHSMALCRVGKNTIHLTTGGIATCDCVVDVDGEVN